MYTVFALVGVLEHFEDKFDDHEIYNEIYDKEFVELYEIIYRDFTDIDYDTNIIYSKISYKNNDKILICGSGVGKLCKKFKEKYTNTVGVDISENMLKKAQTLYPNIKFIRGNIIKPIFNNKSYDIIYIDERTLYYNKFEDMGKIAINMFNWLSEEGYLIVQIYDHTKLQLACRYYSSKYIDNKGNTHGFTYLNDFSHDCYYLDESVDKVSDKNETLNTKIFNYYDKIIFESGHKRIKKTVFNIPDKEIVYDIFLRNGFDIVYIENIRTQIVGGYDLVIFKKKRQNISVDELEKKYNG